MLISEILDYCKLHRNVFCYGAGLYGKIVRSYLLEHGVNIEGFIVSDDAIGNKKVLDVQVISIEDFCKTNIQKSGIIVCVSHKYQAEIRKTLEAHGIYEYFCVDDLMVEDMDQCNSYRNDYSANNNITVFCYHRVADIPLDTWKLAVKPELFAKQVKYIKDNYEVLRSEDDWSRFKGNRAAVITFDDGYEDIYVNALPILEKYGIPATVFVASGNIDTTKEFWWDEIERIIFNSKKETLNEFGMQLKLCSTEDREKACFKIHPYIKKMNYKDRDIYLSELAQKQGGARNREYCRCMSSEQLRKLSQSSIITIGGHTVTHSCLAFESFEEQEYEIEQSKYFIENIIGKKLEVFSYPFGQEKDFTDETIKIAVQSGYDKVFAAFPGIANVQYRNGYIPRINIGQESELFSSIRLLRRYETMYGDV